MEAVNKRISMKRYYIYSGAIITILLIFVFIHEYKGNFYTRSLEDTYALLQTQDINISGDELDAAGPTVLELDIVYNDIENNEIKKAEGCITVPTAKLLDQQFLKQLEQHKGMIVIVTKDVALAVHSWLILTRKGVDNIKILELANNEVLNYSFEPETYL